MHAPEHNHLNTPGSLKHLKSVALGHAGTISSTARVRRASSNAMKPRIQYVLVFRSYAAAACQAARTAVICSGSG